MTSHIGISKHLQFMKKPSHETVHKEWKQSVVQNSMEYYKTVQGKRKQSVVTAWNIIKRCKENGNNL